MNLPDLKTVMIFRIKERHKDAKILKWLRYNIRNKRQLICHFSYKTDNPALPADLQTGHGIFVEDKATQGEVV